MRAMLETDKRLRKARDGVTESRFEGVNTMSVHTSENSANLGTVHREKFRREIRLSSHSSRTLREHVLEVRCIQIISLKC